MTPKTEQPKHTPGRWYIDRHGYESPYMAHAFIVTASESPICGIWSPKGNEEQQANARLIAASPELLVALKAEQAWRDATGEEQERLRAEACTLRKAAIKLAEGSDV